MAMDWASASLKGWSVREAPPDSASLNRRCSAFSRSEMAVSESLGRLAS